MKKIIYILMTVILLTGVACISAFAFAGCNRVPDTYDCITEISGFKDMQSGGDKIEVFYANGSRPMGYVFSIDEKEEIDDIVDMVLSTSLTRLSEPNMSGECFYILTLYQGEKTYEINSSILNRCYSYVFSTNDLFEKISSIARERGAFDLWAGVIYKVVNQQDLQNVKYEKITSLDKDGVIDLINDGYGDFRYFCLFDSDGEASESLRSSDLTELEYGYRDTLTGDKDKQLLLYFICQTDDGTYNVSIPSTFKYNANGAKKTLSLCLGVNNIFFYVNLSQ